MCDAEQKGNYTGPHSIGFPLESFLLWLLLHVAARGATVAIILP